MSLNDHVGRYLQTGEYDGSFLDWPGATLVARCINGSKALSEALVAATLRHAAGYAPRATLPAGDVAAFARAKLAPMVQGLFPAREQQPVLRLLERSVVFLTPENIEDVLLTCRWPGTAWRLANMYLRSLGADPISEVAPDLSGLGEEATCYVSLEYFEEQNPFADYVVHEAAHVFHNCKRRQASLPETRSREWLLDIEFRKRETFAYACELYSRIRELGPETSECRALLADVDPAHRIADDRVDPGEILDIVREAVGARNGWKRILLRCAPAR